MQCWREKLSSRGYVAKKARFAWAVWYLRNALHLSTALNCCLWEKEHLTPSQECLGHAGLGASNSKNVFSCIWLSTFVPCLTPVVCGSSSGRGDCVWVDRHKSSVRSLGVRKASWYLCGWVCAHWGKEKQWFKKLSKFFELSFSGQKKHMFSV